MKKLLLILAVVLLGAVTAMAQNPAPGIFNYQGVARNSVGNVLINQTINLRITIHNGIPTGTILYQESRLTTTNPFGLFNVQVGSGGATNVTGAVQPLTGTGVTPTPWGGALVTPNPKFIQVEIDPAGGTSSDSISALCTVFIRV